MLSNPSLQLKEHEYHLWMTKPEEISEPQLLQSYDALMSVEEREKQQRFVFEKDRHDALVTRAFIRDLLSNYVDCAPEELSFAKGEKGKPELVDPPLPIRFNLSHTKGLIICAVTLNADIGCDVEAIERKNEVVPIADRFFSEKEVIELNALPETDQRDRFFDYWTLKESYIKAWGGGLSIPLADFSFTIEDSIQSKMSNHINLSFAPHRKDNPTHWQSWLYRPNAKHRMAVSIRNPHLGAGEELSQTPYNIRYFESVPLKLFKEVEFSLS